MIPKKELFKILSAWALYVFLHFAFKIYPSVVTAFLGCTEENIYTHMKMAFFSYLIINMIFLTAGRAWRNVPKLFSMMLANCIYPYLAFFIWMIVPALFGQLHAALAEVLYSNVILLICLYMTVSMEKNFLRVNWDTAGRIVIIFFFIVSFVLFTEMTLHMPGIELFEYHSHGQESIH